VNRALRGWIFRLSFVISEEREEKRMQEKLKLQEIPVKVYKTDDRIMVVAPMPGLEPENIMIEVTNDGHLVLYGESANVTYGNGVVTVALLISDHTVPTRLTLERIAPTHGERKGNAGHPPTGVE